MKSEITNSGLKEVTEYPKLMACTRGCNILVLMTGTVRNEHKTNGVGTVVHSSRIKDSDGVYPLGHTTNTWDLSQFGIFDGELLLKN
jgi:hypothetical protein